MIIAGQLYILTDCPWFSEDLQQYFATPVLHLQKVESFLVQGRLDFSGGGGGDETSAFYQKLTKKKYQV